MTFPPKCFFNFNTSEFQFDRDALASTVLLNTIPKSFDKFVGRPQFVHFCDPSAPSTSKFIDVRLLVEKGENILKSGPSWTPHMNKGPLFKLANFHNVFTKMPVNMAVSTCSLIIKLF